MATTASVTVNNQLSDSSLPNNKFDLKVNGDKLTVGKETFPPVDVPSKTSAPNNGGLYTGTADGNSVKGIVSYFIPGSDNQLVVYFDVQSVCLLVGDSSQAVDTNLVTQAASGTSKVTGTLAVDRVMYDWQAVADFRKSPDGKALQGTVTVTSTTVSNARLQG